MNSRIGSSISPKILLRFCLPFFLSLFFYGATRNNLWLILNHKANTCKEDTIRGSQKTGISCFPFLFVLVSSWINVMKVPTAIIFSVAWERTVCSVKHLTSRIPPFLSLKAEKKRPVKMSEKCEICLFFWRLRSWTPKCHNLWCEGWHVISCLASSWCQAILFLRVSCYIWESVFSWMKQRCLIT